MASEVRSILFGTWLRLRSRFEDEKGAIAAEYVLLLTLIAIALIVAMSALGLAISTEYQTARDCVESLAC